MDAEPIFSERLKELMFDAGLDAESLSTAIGYEKAGVYHWRQGLYLPSLKNMLKLADYFKCSIDYLIGLENEYIAVAPKNPPPFNERLLYIMKNKKLNIFKLAKLSGIPRSAIYNWLGGSYTPQIDNLIKLADIFDCTVDYLVGRE